MPSTQPSAGFESGYIISHAEEDGGTVDCSPDYCASDYYYLQHPERGEAYLLVAGFYMSY